MTLILQLPGAIKAPDGSWTKEVELDEMTGVEEDILADMKRDPKKKNRLMKDGPTRVTEILSRVTVRIGNVKRPENRDRFVMPEFFEEAWWNAYTFDRTFAIVRLRQLSLGDVYIFSATCPSCGEFQKDGFNVNLASLKVQEIDFDKAKSAAHPIALPNKQKALWRYLTGRDEMKLVEMRERFPSDIMTSVIFSKLVALGDQPVVEWESVKRMTGANRNALSQAMDKEEGGIETQIENICPNSECQKDFKTTIDAGEKSFFFPSATSLPSKETSSGSPSRGDNHLKTHVGSPSPVARERSVG